MHVAADIFICYFIQVPDCIWYCWTRKTGQVSFNSHTHVYGSKLESEREEPRANKREVATDLDKIGFLFWITLSETSALLVVTFNQGKATQTTKELYYTLQAQRPVNVWIPLNPFDFLLTDNQDYTKAIDIWRSRPISELLGQVTT